MDSPVRQYQKQKDYLRHKLFRKIKRRLRALRELDVNAPLLEMKRRVRLKRYAGGKIPYDWLHSQLKTYWGGELPEVKVIARDLRKPQTFAGRVALTLGTSPAIVRGADLVSSAVQFTPYGIIPAALDLGMDSNSLYHRDEQAEKDVALDLLSMIPGVSKLGLKKSPAKTLKQTWDEVMLSYKDEIKALSQIGKVGDAVDDTYGSVNVISNFNSGKDDEYYYQTQNTETGDVYNVHPSAIGAHNLEVTLPEVKITAPRKHEYRSAYHPEDVEDAFNMTGIGMLFNPFRLARTTGLLLEKPSFNNAVEVAHDVLPWSKPGRFLLGAYNLANKEGLEKTYNLTKTGLYNGAILSGIGDIFNTAMMVEGGLGTASNLGINSITDVKDLLASPYYKYMVNKAAKNSPLSYRLKRLNMSERELQGLLQDPVEYFNQLDAAGLRDPFSPFGLLGVEKIIHEHPEILKEVLNSDKTFKGWSEINVRKLFDEHDILLGRNPDVLNLLTALEDTGIGRDAVENAALNYIRNNRGGVTKSLYDDLYNQWRAGQDITKSMYDSDANKILAFDYYDKVGDKTKDAAKKTLDEIVVGHEAGHSRNRSSFGLPGDFQFNDEFYSLSPLVQKYFLSHRNDEVLLRLGQLYDWYGLTDYKKMSPGMLRFAAKKYADSPTGLDNNMNDFFKYVPLNRSTLDWAINSGMLFNSGKDPGIHINPKNRGKFNALKKRTGKTTELLTHSKNPLTRKRAIFAQNARKWHHK